MSYLRKACDAGVNEEEASKRVNDECKAEKKAL